jgi:repressor LexA
MQEKRTVATVKGQIAGFYRDRRRMPTYSEMVGLLGVRSKSVVDFWVKKLQAEGLLEKDA